MHARTRALVLVAAAGIVAQSCSRPPAAAGFRVALLTSGPATDGGWNQAALEGLKRCESELGAQISHVESREKSKFEEDFRDFAARGFDVVIGHGNEYQDAAARVALEFPKTQFVTVAGDAAGPNHASLAFQIEDATYCLGALSARLSKSGVLGLVGGEEIPSLTAGFEGFRRGARAVRPDVRVVTKFVGSWNDANKATEIMRALVAEGADFVFQNADKAGDGVFAAAAEAKGVYVFGANRDQNALRPEVVLASAVIDIPKAIRDEVASVKEGRFEGRVRRLGMADGTVKIVWNPALASVVPDAVRREIADLESRVAKGTVAVLADR
jgi:basic membrane protein A and related proteins